MKNSAENLVLESKSQELFLFVAPCEGQICANVGLTLNYSRASDCRGLNSEWISRFLLPRFSATSCPPYLLSVETQPVVLRLLGVGYPSHRFTLNLQHSTVLVTAQCPQSVKNANFPPNKFSPADFVPVSLLTILQAHLRGYRCVVGDLRKKFSLLAHFIEEHSWDFESIGKNA